MLREPRYSRSLEWDLAILGCFSPEHHVLGIAELADMVGMSRSTTNRYVIMEWTRFRGELGALVASRCSWL